jgi:hypothetical protein
MVNAQTIAPEMRPTSSGPAQVVEQGSDHQTDADIDRHGLRASEIAVGADAGDDVGDQV